MKKIVLLINIFLLLAFHVLYAQNTLNISGLWQVQLDPQNTGINENAFKPIELPGSLTEAGYGLKTEGSDFGILTPTYKYIGVAWYQKEIEIPKEWENKTVKLFLERVLWESKVYVDSKETDVQDALGTPHIHNLGQLSPGKHLLTVRVNNDMIYNIGDKGHAYSDYTQTIWNGIVGRMELQAIDPIHISSVRTFSLLNSDQLKVELIITSIKKGKAQITLEIRELGSDKDLIKIYKEVKLEQGDNTTGIIVDLEGKLKKWSEFDPSVYVLTSTLKAGKYRDKKATEFGYIEVSHDGTHILINGQPVFLRGNLDCVHFPLTGYPSTKTEEWIKIFQIYKDYGLNHVRFHSWCPPEAAFKAANRLGIYIQAEASVWIDWWMSEDMKAKGRPEMDTKGHPKGLGYDSIRDEFVVAEMNRMVNFYGNNPSFIMFCIGNELGNSDFDVLAQWIDSLKNRDPRRLYSTSTARTITEADDFCATHYISGIGRTRGLNGASTDWDFEKVYSQMNIPIIAHEIGQWPVYPLWKEIEKYKGVLKARNFKEFKATAEKNGIATQDRDFRMASGALNQLMYKYETESFLRTPSCAGVQLLSMQDYQGQGEALIGWLDAFWDSKQITSPEKFRAHFYETVPLLRMKKFVYTNDEVFTGKVQLSHFGKAGIEYGVIVIDISTSGGEIIKKWKQPVENITIGSLTDVAEISMPLSGFNKAARLTITVKLENTDFRNEWDIWVFPSKLPELQYDDIIITNELTDSTLTYLQNGAKVLLIANELGTEDNSVQIDFYPLYWSLTFFPGQGKTSIGMLFNDKHPAFNHFPTSYHSNWQWEPFRKSTKAFILNELPEEYRPIAQVVDDFHRNNKEGVIFEFNIGKGKLLVCGYDINNVSSPAAAQLRYSLLEYLNSDDFNPEQNVSAQFLKKLFPLIPVAEKTDPDSGFGNIILKVDAGANLKEKETGTPWEMSLDSILISKQNTSYKANVDGVWKDDVVSAWFGQDMTVTVNCPEGILGTFYVRFNDWNNKNREGILKFEGRKAKLGSHTGNNGEWIKFHVMREDSNDGKLVLKAKMTKGGNLMISDIVLTAE